VKNNKTRKIRIAIIGEYNYANPMHGAINLALDHASNTLGISLDYYWFKSTEFQESACVIDSWSGIWICPTIENEDIYINIIKDYTTYNIPVLITEHGFYLFLKNYIPSNKYISYSKEKILQTINVVPISDALKKIFNDHFRTEITQHKLGIPQDIRYSLEQNIIDTEATDEQGNIEVLSLKGHPFFVVVQHSPQATSTAKDAHPLICAFINICASELSL